MWRKKKSLSFLPPWEFQTPLSLGTPRLLINLPRNWFSQGWNPTVCHQSPDSAQVSGITLGSLAPPSRTQFCASRPRGLVTRTCCCWVTSVVSDSVRPHRWQPTRLHRPWDSPGKNTGVGCHFLLQCMKEKSKSEVAQLCLTLSDPMDCSPPSSSVHGIFQARVLEWVAIAFYNRYSINSMRWS